MAIRTAIKAPFSYASQPSWSLRLDTMICLC